MSKRDIAHLQHELNYYFATFLPRTTTPLIVDGKRGSHTVRRVRLAKWLNGKQKPLDSTVTPDFLHRLRHPKSLRFANKATVARGIYRRRNFRRSHKKNLQAAARRHGVGTFDGVPCALWMIPYMVWAREEGPKHGVPWFGRLVSGFREPAYSEHLCYGMCGAPSCPGRCAGRASHHSQDDPPNGSIDVSDYTRFAAAMRKCPLEPRIFNSLGAQDPVHFSSTGN